MATTASEADGGAPQRARHRLFLAIACLLPVAFFAAVEIVLRLVGYGTYEPLFVPVEGAAGYMQPNEAVVERFFATADEAPQVSIDTTYFRGYKRPQALRLFVQGGSSAAGFPFGKWASPAGMVKRRLRRAFPDREIEVISTAMAAINSYTLLDFAGEIIAREPDAVLIYAGHNEYLGVLGVGSALSSSHSVHLTRTVLRLRRLRLFRLVERLYANLRGASDGANARRRPGTLMARIAGERRIPFDSSLYHQGLSQFRDNLDALLGAYRKAGVPVFIGTLASNEKDHAPFTSALAEETDLTRWQALYEEAAGAMAAGDAVPARDALESAVALDDGAADAWFALGRTRVALGDLHGALTAYQAARDRDQLRFRAPSAFNDIILELAERHGAMLVESEQAIRRASADRLIGKELMLEHLHPNVRGYFLLADAFYDALFASGLVGEPAVENSEEEAFADIPVTRIDELGGLYRMQRLLTDWPFEEVKQPFAMPRPTDRIEQIAQAWFAKRLGWPEAMNEALVHYQQTGDTDNAVRVALNLAEAFHFLDNPQFIAGQLLVRQGNHRLAATYLGKAVAMAPQRTEYRLALGRAQLLGGNPDTARRLALEVLEAAPDNRRARALLEQVERDR